MLCDNNNMRLQRLLLGVGGVEDLVDLFEGSAFGLDKEEVDEDDLENIPGDVQVVEAPLDTLPCDGDGVGVAVGLFSDMFRWRSS